jgi:hypothetical protein
MKHRISDLRESCPATAFVDEVEDFLNQRGIRD